jgi:hypothetical protein
MNVLLIYALDGEWALVCDEMDFVASLSKLDAEPRGQYPAASYTGITRYAYPQV